MSTKTKKSGTPRTPRTPKMSKSAARAEGAAKTDRLRKAALAEINDRLAGGINPRELARVDGVWFVRWPGFAWRNADADYA